MAMRTLLGYLEDGLVYYRYCHHNDASILCYHTLELTKQLISIGDTKCLYDNLQDTIDAVYDNSPDLPYVNTLADFVKAGEDYGVSYVYLFMQGAWYIYSYRAFNYFKPLKEQLDETI